MSLQMLFHGKSFIAKIAFKWFFSRMLKHYVSLHVSAVESGVIATGTGQFPSRRGFVGEDGVRFVNSRRISVW